MKLEELRLLIKDVVQETMREELRDILTEAVKIASTPSQPVPTQKPHFTVPEWAQLSTSDTQSQMVAEQRAHRDSSISLKKDPMSILAATAKSMTANDLHNFM